MTDIKDLPAIIATMDDPEKLDQISFIIQTSCKGLISHEEADEQINKIIRSKNNEWKQ